MKSTFLLTWNPSKWEWENFNQKKEELLKGIPSIKTWNISAYKKVKEGDRFYLMKLGNEPKGIIASGIITSDAFIDQHWDPTRESTYFVNIQFDTLLDPAKEDIFTLEELNSKITPNQEFSWTPQSCGIEIPTNISILLDEYWLKEYQRQEIYTHEATFMEGKKKEKMSKIYERNVFARTKCLENFGYACNVCGFNFQDVYGDLGENFIEVHHIFPISKTSGEYAIDPIKDLIPVCSNCHRMLHRGAPLKTVEELRTIVEKQKNK